MSIILLPHDPAWRVRFEDEASRLWEALGSAAAAIHHVGSTAVPGIVAKPIIDVLVEATSVDAIDERTQWLEALGYEAKGEFGIPGRRYFRRDEAGNRAYHVHAFAVGSPEVARHLAFRDYLRSHPDVAGAYARLKRELAGQDPSDRAYADGKRPFIERTERAALAWWHGSHATSSNGWAMLPEIIVTPRLRLRPWERTDVDDVFAYAQDQEWSRYLRLMPVPYLRGHAEEFVERQIQLDRGSHPSWAIVRDGRVIGGINLRLDHTNRLGEIGYSLARTHWNQGFCTEAVTAVVEAAFSTEPELNRIRAFADVRNTASQRVMAKVGMIREGVLRQNRVERGEPIDEAWYGLLRSEWQHSARPPDTSQEPTVEGSRRRRSV